ncbi:MAG TPA: acyl-CoA dehydrogenase [Acidobacteria bacterium]|uniref:Acyl-CoA dehydrogenase n=1 Tax=marine metagenome TaxID=408172 RepID=A0A381VHR6_9ZZZZ|nr:acyl-CoA dehydrogenase [Acidobacteriota bacterium]
MATTAPTASTVTGGIWLFEDTNAGATFTPERLSDEHRLIDQTTEEFVSKEIMPNHDQLETKDWDLARRLVQRAGELGLMGTDVPEAYGGIDLDKASSVVVGTRVGQGGSFGSTFGAQTSLSILPLVCFGTETQKQKYLGKLVSGEWVGAYCLSESGSGSDALGAKTHAARQDDGSYVLSGEKMWITNGGFADLYVVFAKVDGEHFTAFLVERGYSGVSNGKEEHKMGLHGSSTTPVILQDVNVPAENVLGDVGKGHKVAFNTLNYGRFKLAVAASGGAQVAIAEAARYAAERHQFGRPIASFGAIKHKLGEMAVRLFAVESMIFRTTGLLDASLADHDAGDADILRETLEELAVECSILKVAGSEMIDYVLDENVQIHGGNGFVKDYAAERHYRDSRVNRIFEGTNEINRLLIPGTLVRRALKDRLPLIAEARRLQDEIMNPPALPEDSDAPLSDQVRSVGAFKKTAVMVLGLAMQRYGEKLTDEQEVLSWAADILIDTFAADSAVVRALQASTDAPTTALLQQDAASIYVNDAAGRIETAAKSALATMAEGDDLRLNLAALRRLLKVTPVNTVVRRRRLADAVVGRAGYTLN